VRFWGRNELDITPGSDEDVAPAAATPATSESDEPKKGWRKKMKEVAEEQWAKNALVVLAALALIHIGAYLLLDDQYSKYFWNRGAVFTQVALGAGFAMRVRKKDAKPPQHWLGSIVLVMALLVVGKYAIWPLLPGMPAQASTSTRTPGQSVYVRSTTTLTPPTERFDEECKARAATLNTEMREKIKVDFKNHPLMIPIACRESGFNQTKRGTTDVLKGEDPDNHGAFQINLTHHAAKIKELGLDVDKYEGNAAYTKYLLSKPRGIDNWFPKVAGRWYAPITTVVPVTKDWSGVIEIPSLTKKVDFIIGNKQKILAEIDGIEVIMDPQNPKDRGDFDKIRFKTIEGSDDTIVTIPMEFWPVR
jgi:hypothetical protein